MLREVLHGAVGALGCSQPEGVMGVVHYLLPRWATGLPVGKGGLGGCGGGCPDTQCFDRRPGSDGRQRRLGRHANPQHVAEGSRIFK